MPLKGAPTNEQETHQDASKYQHWLALAGASPFPISALMSLITACIPARIDRNPASRKVERCRTQRGHHPSAIAAVAVGILMSWVSRIPGPALNAPVISHQLQQGFWCGAQAGEKQAPRLKQLAFSGAGSGHLHNPGASFARSVQVMSRPWLIS